MRMEDPARFVSCDDLKIDCHEIGVYLSGGLLGYELARQRCQDRAGQLPWPQMKYRARRGHIYTKIMINRFSWVVEHRIDLYS
jgi:hypothetical protein